MAETLEETRARRKVENERLLRLVFGSTGANRPPATLSGKRRWSRSGTPKVNKFAGHVVDMTEHPADPAP